VSGRSWVLFLTASYQRRYKNGTRCSPLLSAQHKMIGLASLYYQTSFKKKIDFTWNERSRLININWDDLFHNSLGMRRYGDISIQYRYGGSRYVSWPSAIYRDTTLTFVIKGSHHVISIFVFDEFFVRIRSRKIISVGVVCVKCLLK